MDHGLESWPGSDGKNVLGGKGYFVLSYQIAVASTLDIGPTLQLYESSKTL